MKQPLKWHGGKHYLAAAIIKLMPPHTHYVEPYFGGGVVLLEKDPIGVSEVANDIHGELMNFWRVLQGQNTFATFARLIELTPFSQVEWEAAAEPTADLIDRAVRFFIRCRQSRAGKFKEFATLSRNRTRRGMNEQVSAWLTAVAGLPAVHARIKRPVLLNKPAIDVIRSQDGPNTLFYLDPPYLHETRQSANDYAHEMTMEDHEQLLFLLGNNGVDGFPTIDGKPDRFNAERKYRMQGKWLLSGYNSRAYAATAELNGWRRVEFDLPNNAAGGKSKRRMTECVWMNY